MEAFGSIGIRPRDQASIVRTDIGYGFPLRGSIGNCSFLFVHARSRHSITSEYINNDTSDRYKDFTEPMLIISTVSDLPAILQPPTLQHILGVVLFASSDLTLQ